MLQTAAVLGLAEQHGVVEQAGHELHHAGQVLDLAAPVALGVVVELCQAYDGAAGDERHGERAGVAPLAVSL